MNISERQFVTELESVLQKLSDLLNKWGLNNEDWILTGQYADKLLGYETKVRKGHLNIVVDKKNLPWDTKDALEVQPPMGTVYGEDFEKIIQETNFDFDLLLVTKGRFSEIKEFVVEYKLANSPVQMLNPLGELSLLEDTIRVSDEKGWGIAKGRRMLSWIESFGASLGEQGFIEFADAFKKTAKKYAYVKEPVDDESQSGNILKGIAVSKGKVRGVVKIVSDPTDSNLIEGDILVTRMTDPKFIPLLKKAKAIVTDEGGQLCHAAIIARELGISCVVGTWNATKILKDDMEIEVDAYKGTVKILPILS